MSEETEERTRVRHEDELLSRLVRVLDANTISREQSARVEERTTHLGVALTELKRMHENGTRDVTAGLAAVQKSNESETQKVLAAMKDHIADDKTQFDGLNIKVNNLENWRSNMTGRILGASAAIGVVAGFVAFLLNKFL